MPSKLLTKPLANIVRRDMEGHALPCAVDPSDHGLSIVVCNKPIEAFHEIVSTAMGLREVGVTLGIDLQRTV